jgi:hypothetical protein
MSNNYEKLHLGAVQGGKPIDQVNFALDRAIENCLDPNTGASGARKVVLTLSLSPSADRATAEISFKVETKLQGDAPGMDVVHLHRQRKVGYVSTGHQMDIQDAINANETVDKDGVVTQGAPEKGEA